MRISIMQQKLTLVSPLLIVLLTILSYACGGSGPGEEPQVDPPDNNVLVDNEKPEKVDNEPQGPGTPKEGTDGTVTGTGTIAGTSLSWSCGVEGEPYGIFSAVYSTKEDAFNIPHLSLTCTSADQMNLEILFLLPETGLASFASSGTGASPAYSAAFRLRHYTTGEPALFGPVDSLTEAVSGQAELTVWDSEDTAASGSIQANWVDAQGNENNIDISFSLSDFEVK